MPNVGGRDGSRDIAARALDEERGGSHRVVRRDRAVGRIRPGRRRRLRIVEPTTSRVRRARSGADGGATLSRPARDRRVIVPRQWIRLDVNFWEDDKIIAVGPAAAVLYLQALTLAKRVDSRDGVLSWAQLEALPITRYGDPF